MDERQQKHSKASICRSLGGIWFGQPETRESKHREHSHAHLAIRISKPAVILSPRSARGRSGWLGGGSFHPRGGAKGCCASCAYWHLFVVTSTVVRGSDGGKWRMRAAAFMSSPSLLCVGECVCLYI